MHTDAFFTIGKTHTVCEDYAVAGLTENGLAYAIVSDGCSGSPRTDFGARFLATVAEVQIKTHQRMPDGNVVIHQADSARRILGLPQSCLDATLLIATMDDYTLRVSMWGDGICAILNGKQVTWLSVEYTHGAPGYLTYSINPSRQEVYLRESDNYERSRQWHRDASGLATQTGAGPVTMHLPADAVTGVILFSDGVETFQDVSSGIESIPTGDVIDHVLDIKSLTGAYLTRRCKKFLAKHCKQNSWQHADDFSCAGIMK